MAMTGFEKRLVNRQAKSKRNIQMVRARLQSLDVDAIRNVLELGCGTGQVSAWLENTFQMDVHGTDFDPDQIETARRINSEKDRLHFSVEDAVNLTFESNRFDLVISQNVFHHIPQWEKAVSEVNRVLKPGGFFIWYDLTFSSFFKKILQSISKGYGFYTLDEVKHTFNEAKFLERFYEKDPHFLFTHHHFVLEKKV